MPAGNQPPARGNMGGRAPTDQRHQRHPDRVVVPPPVPRGLLVADETSAWPRLERASAQRRVRGGGQSGGIQQSHRPRLPGIRGEQRCQQVVVDAAPSRPAHAPPELGPHPHIGPPAWTPPPGELPPRALFRQHLDQQVHGRPRRAQTQQVNAKKLGREGFTMAPAGVAVRPAFVDEIVGCKRIQEFA